MASMRRVPLLCVAVLAACGLSESNADAPTPTGGTLGGVGVLPSTATTEPTASTARSSPSSAAETTERTAAGETVGERTDGNRVIIIGDSIIASTAKRYSNDMCNALVPLGWVVEVDAESSRFIDFADKVLDARLDDGWDAAVIGLGSNYDGDQQRYQERLTETVKRLAPRPVVLVTVTLFKEDRAEVNDVMRVVAAQNENVILMDWEAVTSGERRDEVLGGDGLHLSDAGRVVLAEEVAAVLGTAPAQPGECLKTRYNDDSGGDVRGTGGGKPPPTTIKRRTTPTTRPASQTTKPTASTTPRTSPGTTNAPPPQPTNPPPTNPPPTNPPPTNPPPTNPPPNT
jgi:hypothetical protein